MFLNLNEVQQSKLESWTTEVNKKAHHALLEQNKDDQPMLDFLHTWSSERSPYYGAIGGNFTFMITPTGVGDIVKVQELITGDILDVTDFDSW